MYPQQIREFNSKTSVEQSQWICLIPLKYPGLVMIKEMAMSVVICRRPFFLYCVVLIVSDEVDYRHSIWPLWSFGTFVVSIQVVHWLYLFGSNSESLHLSTSYLQQDFYSVCRNLCSCIDSVYILHNSYSNIKSMLFKTRRHFLHRYIT